MKSNRKGDKFMGSVKVGPKGQIVIPKEVRDMFDINPGDTLILLADGQRGIAIDRYGTFARIADEIFAGKSKAAATDEEGKGTLEFAKAVREIKEDE